MTRAQMLGATYTRSRIQRRRENAELRTLQRGVYLHASADPTWRQTLRSATITAGPNVFATAGAALALYGVVGDGGPIVVAVPIAQRLARSGCVVVRTRRPMTRTRVLDGIPVVSLERALLDAAGFLSEAELECVIEAALRENLTTEFRLWTTLVHEGGRGVAGSTAFRRVLQQRPAGRPARSVLEVMATQMLRRGGVRDFIRNHAVVIDGKRYELDFAFVNQKVVVEVDGRAFHSTATQVGRDRVRQAALEADGWRFLRVSWFDVVCEPDRVLRDLAELLAT